MLKKSQFLSNIFSKSFLCYSTNIPGQLNDISVLDLTRVIAGPFCSMCLGDLGANVIKIESIEGEESRKWAPFVPGSTDSTYFMAVNRNKKSLCVDLKKQEGKQIIYDLAKKCDVMIENYIPGKLDEIEVGYERLRAINPRLVYATITGFGYEGPYAKRPGYDMIAAAMGGLLNCTGEKGGRPVKPAVPLTDLITGLHAFAGIMTALYRRHATGRGQKVDCNLLSSQISSMVNIASTYLHCGIEPQKMGSSHVSLAPCESFETLDGDYFLCAATDAQFKHLCRLLNKEGWMTDERFASNAKRVQNSLELAKAISGVMKSKTKKEWYEILKDGSFPNGPINSMKDVFEDEHVKAIGLVKELPHSDAGVVKVVGPPTVYSDGGNVARFAPPRKGEHTREVLSIFLGYSNKKIGELYANKTIQ